MRDGLSIKVSHIIPQLTSMFDCRYLADDGARLADRQLCMVLSLIRRGSTDPTNWFGKPKATIKAISSIVRLTPRQIQHRLQRRKLVYALSHDHVPREEGLLKVKSPLSISFPYKNPSNTLTSNSRLANLLFCVTLGSRERGRWR